MLWLTVFSFVISIVLTFFIRRLALRFNVLDQPTGGRKIHQEPTPLFGGLALFLSFFIVLAVIYFINPEMILDKQLVVKNLAGLFFGGLVLMIGGFLDDKYNLAPKFQIIFPMAAVIIVIVSGIGIHYINNPFGGLLDFTTYEWILFWHNGIAYKFTLLADVFTFLWLMGMMYTTKFLDGLDGLVSGITIIGALIIAGLSLLTRWYQPEVAALALILAAVCAGFLIFNWHPAKIFLGEGGSLFCGFMLGALGIISGSKVATTLLVVGIPVLDVLWVILRRIFVEKKSPFRGDAKHLHFRLLNLGFSHRGAVLFLYFLSVSFGAGALFLQSRSKLWALAILVLVMLVLAILAVRKSKSSAGL
ncbi:MAG: MraY family glycosyltransferase [Patescibacteria group bacterium]|nr:MraY family glycosyltransferase [Patescibacteria group bacterium]MDD5490544.1 MraY family glycosyltransferase [Patescibacteria group bacterium]